MRYFIAELRTSIIATLALAVIFCGIYPVVVWGIAQIAFPAKANGSLITRDGKIIGSELIGQNFSDPKYFHPRPSSAGDTGYDATSSGGSNLGPLSKKLVGAVKERIEAYRAENDLATSVPIPADAVTASASGLDPHISIANALLQAKRIAKARSMPDQAVLEKIKAYTEGRDLGIFGEPRINVMKINLALDDKK
jgi:potassium-transporting ATPase KdpC subunit